EQAWVIFPEGAMIKDKKIVNREGEFEIYHHGERRRPFTGAAVLALQAELCRQVMLRLRREGDKAALDALMARFEITSLDPVAKFRTVIVPVNITYFPIRSQENFFLNMAKRMSDHISARGVEELSVEGTILAKDTDIDITLGEPIDIPRYLDADDLGQIMARGGKDLVEIEENSHMDAAARVLMNRYMAEIYGMTRINFDHIFATLIRNQKTRKFTERSYRNRIFLSALRIRELGKYKLHTILENNYKDIIYEDPSAKFTNFMELCLKEGILLKEGNLFVRAARKERRKTDFHAVRQNELTTVIANEIEPLADVTAIIKEIAEEERPELSRKIREIFLKEDQKIFEEDYAKYYIKGETKEQLVGRPYLLVPKEVKAGIVLVHGYLAAPLEVKAMADFFHKKGYAVYAVRIRGHGTSAEDLGQTTWESWYESFNRGYTIVKSLTDEIIVGGFSTGGGLALLAAGKKGCKIRAAFSINAPLHLRNYAVHLIPPMAMVNKLIARVRGRRPQWDYVENSPENIHINYTRNPMSAIKQLSECIREMENSLPQVRVPTLLVQASKDHVVDPVSGQLIFSQVGTPKKELLILERERHGIINGEGSQDVFDRVNYFLDWAREQPACVD
ncbi:alpha/beta fold hydrolase, partial [Candidatus Sumerlaeota bacterium]|nr:alpha/beta fold hydrolase [Candidatus Sumerlaeota bacterium]